MYRVPRVPSVILCETLYIAIQRGPGCGPGNSVWLCTAMYRVCEFTNEPHFCIRPLDPGGTYEVVEYFVKAAAFTHVCSLKLYFVSHIIMPPLMMHIVDFQCKSVGFTISDSRAIHHKLQGKK